MLYIFRQIIQNKQKLIKMLPIFISYISMSQVPRPDKKLKISLIGDKMVGKTCLIHQFLYGEFIQKYTSTVGVDFTSKNIQIDGLRIRLQIWDTAGQERFISLIPSYIRDAAIVVFLFDLTRIETLQIYEKIYRKIVQNQTSQKVYKVLVGNKKDLKPHEKITLNSVQKIFQRNKFDYYQQLSAIEYNEVTKFFTNITKTAINSDQNGKKQFQFKKNQENQKHQKKQVNPVVNFFQNLVGKKSIKVEQKVSQYFNQQQLISDNLLQKEESMLDNHSQNILKEQKILKQASESCQSQFANFGLSQTTLKFLQDEKINLQILIMMERNQIKDLKIPIGDQYRIISALQKK